MRRAVDGRLRSFCAAGETKKLCQAFETKTAESSGARASTRSTSISAVSSLSSPIQVLSVSCSVQNAVADDDRESRASEMETSNLTLLADVPTRWWSADGGEEKK